MKISNEAKIGLIAIAALVLLFMGMAYLKGNSIFQKEVTMYAVYKDVLGLKKSNPVVINGLQVGKISDIDGGKDMRNMVVSLTFTKDVNIPENSVAIINPNLLGSTSLEIQLGNALAYKTNGDTISTAPGGGAIDEALKVLNPVLYEVRNAVNSLDSVLQIIATTFDPTVKSDIKDIFNNLNMVSQSFTVSAKTLEETLNPQTGSLGQTLNNVKVFTKSLSNNSASMDSIFKSVSATSRHLSEVDLKQSVDSLNAAISSFKAVAEKVNSKDGSLGLLLNDKNLYNNLEATTQKLNTLIDDVRVHPRRYVNISVFGRKDKGNYLVAPISNDTLLLVNP